MYKSNMITWWKWQIIVDKEEKMNTWRNYIEYLYEDTSRPEMVPDFGEMNNLFLMSVEVEKVMSQIKKISNFIVQIIYMLNF